jgi:hypothetical protein
MAQRREGRHETAQEEQLERKLKSASGPEFDRLFLQQTSSDHERLIRKLQQEREESQLWRVLTAAFAWSR